MKHYSILLLFAVTLFASCSSNDAGLLGDSDGLFADSSSGSSTETGGESSSNGGQEGSAGLITAAEWNDLSNWDFWTDLLDREPFDAYPEKWELFTVNQRMSVKVENEDGQGLSNVHVDLMRDGLSVWQTKTDNAGSAELWLDPSVLAENVNLSTYSISLDGVPFQATLKLHEQGENVFVKQNAASASSKEVQLAFVVDATGSMSDELDFLQEDLKDVMEQVETVNPSLEFFTSSVFYRDESDDYLVKHQDFSGDIESSKAFIELQMAGGGGDYPEAVHSGLVAAVDELSWSNDAYTKLAFLILDAPPHHNPNVIEDLHYAIEKASKMGIKIIPITASGIDQETEFLMRTFSIITNGTYVFITDDSGIGNDHLEASVGEFEVEFLNDLMVRLINKYTE